MICLFPKPELSYYSTFESQSLNVLQFIEDSFGPVSSNAVHTESSAFYENCPRL